MSSNPLLRYKSVDPEARCSLPVGRFTTPHPMSSLFVGILLMGVVYSLALAFKDWKLSGVTVWEYFTGFTGFPIVMMSLSCWSAGILIIKALKIRAQRLALSVHIVPDDPKFTVTASTAQRIVQTIGAAVEDSRKFMYFNRVIVAMRSMRNVGRVGDIDEMLQSAASNDESIVESGYTLLKGFVWSIPVLGFIGTVVGLTQTMGSFKVVLVEAKDANNDPKIIIDGLGGVLGGLDTAFITTGEALILVFFIHMVSVFVRSADEALLDDVREVAHENIAGRVRIEPDSRS